jgi:hypothetical protein
MDNNDELVVGINFAKHKTLFSNNTLITNCITYRELLRAVE